MSQIRTLLPGQLHRSEKAWNSCLSNRRCPHPRLGWQTSERYEMTLKQFYYAVELESGKPKMSTVRSVSGKSSCRIRKYIPDPQGRVATICNMRAICNGCDKYVPLYYIQSRFAIRSIRRLCHLCRFSPLTVNRWDGVPLCMAGHHIPGSW